MFLSCGHNQYATGLFAVQRGDGVSWPAWHRGLLHEHKIYCRYEKQEGGDVIPPQLESLKRDKTEDHKDYQRYDLLHHLELYKGERASIAFIAYTVGRHLETILKEGNAPRHQYHDI